MHSITIPMSLEGSLPDSRLTVYLQENSKELWIQTRPLVLLCPGGGYEWTSDREAEVLALPFLAMGYHAAVLRYSCAPARFPTALLELAFSLRTIRENAGQWHVEPEHVFVLGCSAGGHLAASLGVMWNRPFLRRTLDLPEEDAGLLRPDGLILCYPVITAGPYAHEGSFQNLLGDRVEELREQVSLEKLVTGDTPPVFLWHTFTDPVVPVENALLFVEALRRAKVPTEFHMYASGGHGLSLATDLTRDASGGACPESCAGWISLVHTWLAEQCRR